MQLPKSDNQKLKILYILDYLQKNSHQDHPVRASELAKMLEGHGILCDRKTVYSDIAALQDFGIDILIYRGKNGGYYIGQRQFQLPELKLLIGAVQSSRFLTEEKSLELIDKLCRLCSQEEAEQVRRNVVVAGRIKNMNQSIYYDVDTIQEAIFQNRQISFRYFDWGLDGKPYTMGALVLSNHALFDDLIVAGTPIHTLLNNSIPPHEDKGSIITVLATDIPLSERQLRRLCRRALVGLSRTGSYCGNGSGEIVIAFTTANRVPHYSEKALLPMTLLHDDAINPLFRAVAECVEESVLSSLLHAETVTGNHGQTFRSLTELLKNRA